MNDVVASTSRTAPRTSSGRRRGALGGGQLRVQPHQRDQADREVDVEDEAPARMLDQQPADQRPDDRRHGERRGDIALVAAALPWRDEVADARHRERHQATGGHALQRTYGDQEADVVRDAAERRGRDESRQRDLEQGLAAVAVAQLAPQRRGRRGGDDVRRHDPRELGDRSEVRGDRRQRGREDRLVEDGRQHRQDDHRERDAHGGWRGGVHRSPFVLHRDPR